NNSYSFFAAQRNLPRLLPFRRGFVETFLHPSQFVFQAGGALRHRNGKQEKYGPSNQVRHKHTVQVFQLASNSRSKARSSSRDCSSSYRWRISKAIRHSRLIQDK